MRRLPIILALAFCAAPSAGGANDGDPVAACRAAHGDDQAARIVCLEEAIYALSGGAPAGPVASAEETPARASGLGAEQVLARLPAESKPKPEKQEPDRATVTITEVVYDRNKRAIFFMEDGQIWREAAADRPGARLNTSRQYGAEIKRSGFGGYRMDIDGVRRMFKVERVQ